MKLSAQTYCRGQKCAKKLHRNEGFIEKLTSPHLPDRQLGSHVKHYTRESLIPQGLCRAVCAVHI